MLEKLEFDINQNYYVIRVFDIWVLSIIIEYEFVNILKWPKKKKKKNL